MGDLIFLMVPYCKKWKYFSGDDVGIIVAKEEAARLGDPFHCLDYRKSSKSF